MKTNWIELLTQHQAQTTQMAKGLYEVITGAETLDEIVDLPGYNLTMAGHRKLLDQQNEVRERGLDHSDLLGEVMAFKVIGDQIMAEENMLCSRY
jgi:hypothetical protein